MGNVLRIFARDVKRLFRAPAALVVALVLLVLPSLYAWYNVIGFWNPYDSTGNLRVCVVNEDAGGSSDLTGQLDVGASIVDELHGNDQLDWTFVSRDEASRQVESGQAYAAFIIPSDFTERMLSLTKDTFEAPSVTYLVNEKAGPVAPKITDAGATTLDETINSTFVKTVSNVAVEAIDAAIGDIRDSNAATSVAATGKIDAAVSDVAGARSKLASMRQALDGVSAELAQSQAELPAVRDELGQATELAQSLSSDIKALEQEMTQFSKDVWPLVSRAISDVQSASSEVRETAATLQGSLAAANGEVNASIGRAQAAVGEARAAAASLRDAADALPTGSNKDALLQAAATLEAECDSIDALLVDVSALASRTQDAADAAAEATAQADESIKAATGSLQGAADTFFGTAIPAMSSGLLGASSALSSVSAAAATQSALIDQVDGILGQLQGVSRDASEAVGFTDGLMADVEESLQKLKTDIVAVLGSGALLKLADEHNLDAQSIADFMGSPTEVVTEQLYPLNAYGSAMAPLFMNLTFWIGAFMLLVIMRQEVDDEGLKRLKLWQRYLGRFLLFACMAVLQALICVAGVLFIGVEAASVASLAFAAAVSSLAYLSIIYALSVTLQHVGKGICILLVFAQIPGATGLYPVEMTSPFFQAIYPLLPFTYGIEAMRESICGFYGTAYAHDLAMLGAFFVGALAIGLGVRPLMSNVNRMVASQVRKSGIFNGENVEDPPRPFRFSQAVRILADREDYREKLEQRYRRFEQLYPRIIRATVVLSIAVPVALMLVFALSPAEKVVILTIWLLWLLAVLVALVVLESMRSSFKRQISLNDLSDESIVRMAMARRSGEAVQGMQAEDAVGPQAEAGKPKATSEKPSMHGGGEQDG